MTIDFFDYLLLFIYINKHKNLNIIFVGFIMDVNEKDMNALEQLRKLSIVVADSGEIDAIKKFCPRDTTTNPTLLLKASQNPENRHLFDDAICRGLQQHGREENDVVVDSIVMKLFVNFGQEILSFIPGRVSIEVFPELSFDVKKSVQVAEKYIALFEQAGISRKRILIKLASTWEGIQAAKHLESEGIHCNMTLVFSLVQAIAIAEAGVTLISPFVGRVLDWQKSKEGRNNISAEEDRGVQLVRNIYCYYKKFEYCTEIMAASFRNPEQILALAGCELLTISPALLSELQNIHTVVLRALDVECAKKACVERRSYSEETFRWEMCEDEMASVKLEEGMRNFSRDTSKLRHMIVACMENCRKKGEAG